MRNGAVTSLSAPFDCLNGIRNNRTLWTYSVCCFCLLLCKGMLTNPAMFAYLCRHIQHRDTEEWAMLLVLQLAHCSPPIIRCVLQEYCSRSSDNKRHLTCAFLPAVRLAINAGSTKKSPAPQLVKYAGQLLQIPVASTTDADNTATRPDEGQEALALQILAEVDCCSASATCKTKDYVKELCNVSICPCDGCQNKPAMGCPLNCFVPDRDVIVTRY